MQNVKKEILNLYPDISEQEALKNKLLKDCKLNGKTLEYELNKPFDKLLSCPDYQEWPEITINHLDEFDKMVV